MATFVDGVKVAHEKQLDLSFENLNHRKTPSEDFVKGGSFFEEKVELAILDKNRKRELTGGVEMG
jgi:hypothetical protein